MPKVSPKQQKTVMFSGLLIPTHRGMAMEALVLANIQLEVQSGETLENVLFCFLV